MSAVCPAGHRTVAHDYCDVCGLPVHDAASRPGSGPASILAAPTGSSIPTSSSAPGATQVCPNCSAPNPENALFCEACGYDFTTGTMPTPPDPAPTTVQPPPADAAPAVAPGPPTDTAGGGSGFAWVVEVWVDPAWYRTQESPDPLPSADLPVVHPLRGRSVLVGRTSRSRNVLPDIDCQADAGVSRRQCQLTTDGSRWWVTDLDSANGTFVGPASGALPEDPVPVGTQHELQPDDRIYVGAWTRLVLRPATAEELETLA